MDGTVEEPFLFAIECLTCQRRLVVRSEAAIGAILTCPKCGSMVHVKPPDGWVPPAKPTVPEGIGVAPAVSGIAAPSPVPKAPASPGGLPKAPLPVARHADNAEVPLHRPPPLPPQGVVGRAPTDMATPAVPPALPPPWHGAVTWKWVLWAVLPAAVLGLAVGAWAVFGPSGGSEDAEADPEAAATVAPGDDLPDPPPIERPRPRLDRRFLPARTCLVFSLRTSAMAGDPTAEKIVSRAGPAWESSVGRVLKGFKLGLRSIHRLTWAATDLTAWPEQSLVLIELEKDQDAAILRGLGEPVSGLQVAGIPCRRFSDSGWTAPWAVLDSKTILTGRRELLEESAAGSRASLESPPVDRLLKEGPDDAEFSLVLDLAAARRAGLRLPGARLDGWSAGKDSWHTIWETPQAVGLWLRRTDGLQADLVLPCDGEVASERVRAAFDRLVPAARAALDSAAGTLTTKVQGGQGAAANAGPYDALLSQSRDALAAARWEATAGTVWFRVRLGQTLTALATALDGPRTADPDWLDALLKPGAAKAPAPVDHTAKAPAAPSPKASPATPDVKPPEDEPPEDDEPDESVVASPRPDVSVPAKVDVRARLADRWPEVSLPGVPLTEAVRLIGRMSTLRIALDLDAMADVGAAPRGPVNVRLKGATTGEILAAIAAQCGLEPAVVDDRILLTLPQTERNALRPAKYDVSDLLRGQGSAADLAATVRTLVAPASWQQAGGQGTIEVDGGSLVVHQTGPVHRQVQSLLARLRLARGLPAGDREFGSAGLQTRLDRARAKLREPVTVNFSAPTPIEEILAELEEMTGTTILVDWAALGAERRVADPRGVLQVYERPLSEALVTLLQPLDLGYRIAGPDVFEVTTRKAVADRLELEFYPVKDLLSAGESGEALAGQVKGRVSSATWTDSGGKGVVRFDRPSGHLMVLQSQPVQAAVQILVRKMAVGGRR